MAVGLAFATLPVMSAELPTNKRACEDEGFVWNNEKCCLYIYNKQCITFDNWEELFGNTWQELGCKAPALYIDAHGNPQCCPDDSTPNPETHVCECADGFVFDSSAGRCVREASEQSYTITLNSNGGSSGNTYIYTVHGVGGYLESTHQNLMTTSANPAHVPVHSAGYAFLGYYTAQTGGTQVINHNGYVTSAGTTLLSGYSANTSLYAHWNTNCYVIELDNTTYCDGGGVLRIYTTNNGNEYGNVRYSDPNCSTSISGLSALPTAKSHSTFNGYYALYTPNGATPRVIDSAGALTSLGRTDSILPGYTPWHAVCTCNDGWQGSGNYTGTQSGATWSGTCTEGVTVTLDDTMGGNSYIYTRKGTTSTGGVYLDDHRANKMSTSANPVTVPTNSGSGVYFDGYWSAATGGTQYIDANGRITSAGINAGIGYGASNTGVIWYAHWNQVSYTVTLDANGGTIPSGGTTSVSAVYGDAMPTIQTGNKLPTREYYTFAGYYDTSAATGGTMYYTAAGASARTWDKTANTILYARWKKVSYSLQLSKAPITECQFADKFYYYTPADGKWYSNAALTNEITTGGVNYDPSCDGYVFRGWYWNSPSGYNDPIGPGAVMTHNTTIAAGQNAPNSYQPYALNANNLTGKSLSSHAHLYARWAQNCATVANGSCSLNVEANGNVTYTDSCNSNYSLVENGVYNPVCSPVYTVSFRANGGSGSASPTSVTCVYDQDCTLAAKGTLAKSNATFDGWNTETDGSGDGYLESDTVQNLTSTAGATVVLYAVWRTSGCSAGLYLNGGACVSCPAGYSCAGGDASPVMCGTNKYSTGGAVNCSSCTGGLTTSPIADSRYHDEAADCGRKLHIGAYEIRLKSIPSTGSLSSLVPSPALRFNYAGNASGRPDFYAKMSTIASPMRISSTNGMGAISTTGSGDKFKTRYNNTNYYVCDDVTCVTE